MTADDRVAEILGDWYARGETETPEELLRAHPEVAEPLRAALAARELLGCARSPAATPAPAGARTLGDFRLLRELGRGGMGVVYEAEQRSMGRRVALKILDPAITFSAKAVERFRREAQAAGRLHHTNIVPVFGMGEVDGVWYYAMEWVRGTTLAQVIEGLRRRAGAAACATEGTVPAGARAETRAADDVPPDASGLSAPEPGRVWYTRVATACAGVADALGVAHDAGVVHRDVKPSNLVFDAAGTLKVMDFGLAHVEGEASRTVTGDLLGTPAYMSPEQALGGGAAVDGRTDVYALGATLYELLTLRVPFQGEDPRETCVHVLTREPTRPRRLRPDLPRDLETIVLKAMEKDPARRYPTAEALAADLRAFAAGRAIEARRVGWMGRAWRGAKRHRALSSLGVVVAALVVAVSVLAVQAADEATFRRRLERDRLGARRLGPEEQEVLSARERQRVAHEAYPGFGHPPPVLAGPDWAEMRQISVPSYAMSAVFLGGRLYAISGYYTARVAVYDPGSGDWADVAPLPRPLQYFGAAALDGKIYVAGGDYGGAGASAGLLVYDPAANTWTERAPMPGGARWGVGAAALGGRLWVLGGMVGMSDVGLSRVEVYDPASDRWTEGTPLPAPRTLHGGVAEIGGRLYVAGGAVGRTWVTTLEVYDPATDAWTTKAALPGPSSAQAAVVEGRLFMVGGGGNPAGSAVYAYDPATDEWTREPPLLYPRFGHGVAYDPAGRRLYAISGFDGSWLPSCEVCSPRPRAPR